MAAKLSIDILSDFNPRGVREAESSMGRLGRTGSKLGGLLKGAAVSGALAAGAAVTAFGVKAATAASDLQQSFGAIESTFTGKGLAAIKAFGETSATSVGLATAEFNQLAAVTGSMLQNLGYNSTQAADATTQLATRAADLAATFNTDTSTALDAMNAALRGEMDPLEQFGIKLSAADVKAKAVAMGLDMSTAAAQKHATAQASLALIMEQSASKAGTFAQETGSMAGGMQVLGAQLANIAAQIGTAFMPIIQALLGFIQASIIPALQQFANWVTNLGTTFSTATTTMSPFQAVLDAAKAAFDAIWPVIQQVIALVANLATTIGTALQPVVQAVAQFISGTFLPVLASIWQTIGSQLIPAWNQLVSALGPVLNVLGRVAASLRGPLSAAFRVVGAAIRIVITIIGRIISVIARLISGATRAASAVGGAFTSAWNSARSALSTVIGVIGRAVSAVMRVAGAVRGVFASAWRSASSAIYSVIGVIYRVIGAINSAISAVRSFFSSGIGRIGGLVGGLFRSGGGSRVFDDSPRGRVAAARAASGRPTTVTVHGSITPQDTARAIGAIMTGARVRTGYLGIPA